MLGLRTAGLSIIPVKSKTKSPTIPWKKYQTQIAGIYEIKTWKFCDGVAIVAGKVSGGITCIDIDLKYDEKQSIHKEYFDSLRDAGFEAALKKTCIQKTPSGGYHVLFRQKEPGGNMKLARTRDGKQATIETRGEHGYFICAPTPGWEVIHGSLFSIPNFDERTADAFIQSAKFLDEYIEPVYVPARRGPKPKNRREYPSGKDCFKDFNERGTIEDILSIVQSSGWKIGFKKGKNIHLTRPGKKMGTSATLFEDTRTFYVFTSSTNMENGKGYSPSDVMIAIKHEGDSSGAARELKEMGFGK